MIRRTGALLLLGFLGPWAVAEEFVEEPAARALHDRMLKALDEATSLSYESAYRWESAGREIGHCTYRAWLAKPNLFRLEATKADGTKAGVIVGDGKTMRLHWNGDRPFFSSEDEADWAKSKRNVYIQEPAPPLGHSIAHKTGLLGAGMSMAILNPSRFHGCPDSLGEYLDGVRGCGVQTIANEVCDGIEVSYMSHQRSVYLWISRKDGLPRKLRQVVRVSDDIVSEERWTNVRRNAAIDPTLFRWNPPEGWEEWRLPRVEDRMVKAGERAPDFRLRTREGGRTALSDHRGKIVWLCFWRVG